MPWMTDKEDSASAARGAFEVPAPTASMESHGRAVSMGVVSWQPVKQLTGLAAIGSGTASMKNLSKSLTSFMMIESLHTLACNTCHQHDSRRDPNLNPTFAPMRVSNSWPNSMLIRESTRKSAFRFAAKRTALLNPNKVVQRAPSKALVNSGEVVWLTNQNKQYLINWWYDHVLWRSKLSVHMKCHASLNVVHMVECACLLSCITSIGIAVKPITNAK